MPLTVVEDNYVIVDNGAAIPGGRASGRVRRVDDELVEVHWHALNDASIPTAASMGEYRRDAATLRC